MLSSEDAFSYAIARTEKCGSNSQKNCGSNGGCLPCAIPFELRPKKIMDVVLMTASELGRRTDRPICDSVRAPTRKNNRCGSHEGEHRL